MINEPGKSFCELCNSEPPESAFVDETEEKEKMEKLAEEKKKEEDRIKRQEDEE